MQNVFMILGLFFFDVQSTWASPVFEAQRDEDVIVWVDENQGETPHSYANHTYLPVSIFSKFSGHVARFQWETNSQGPLKLAHGEDVYMVVTNKNQNRSFRQYFVRASDVALRNDPRGSSRLKYEEVVWIEPKKEGGPHTRVRIRGFFKDGTVLVADYPENGLDLDSSFPAYISYRPRLTWEDYRRVKRSVLRKYVPKGCAFEFVESREEAEQREYDEYVQGLIRR